MNGIAALGGILVALIAIAALSRGPGREDAVECVRCHSCYFPSQSDSVMPEFFCSHRCQVRV